MTSHTDALPVVVIGAGPVGLAAAAHLVQRGFTPLILEAGDTVAANLASYRHVRLFSPWRYDLDSAARSLLQANGWREPDLAQLPTAGELIDHYLQPLADLPTIAPHLHFRHQVTQLTRSGIDKVKTANREAAPFVVRVRTRDGERDILAHAVIDAAGTWSHLNPLGASGLPAIGEAALSRQITYGMPDILGAERSRYAGKRVLVVGAGHSAVGNLIALAELATQEADTAVVWAVRGNNLGKVFGGGSADQLPARGRLGRKLQELQLAGRLEVHTSFRLAAMRLLEDGIEVLGVAINGVVPTINRIDEVIGATGARPDLQMTRELRLRLDPWLESTDAIASLIDPNLHSCGTVRPHGHRELAHPEVGYYAVGAKSYGRAPNFLMATGYEQVRSIVAALAGDFAAADDVQLALPETGVCNTAMVNDEKDDSPSTSGVGGCCGGAAPTDVNACCVLDVVEKAKGRAGCGCDDVAEVPRVPAKRAATSCCA